MINQRTIHNFPCISQSHVPFQHVRCVFNPCCNLNSLRANNFPIDQAGIHHEVGPQIIHSTLEWLVKADVNGLTERGTSSWDVLNLDTQILHFGYHCWHHVAVVKI